MARIETVTYLCDICKEHVKDKDELSFILLSPGASFCQLPSSCYNVINVHNLHLTPLTKPLRIEVCNNCMMETYRSMASKIDPVI